MSSFLNKNLEEFICLNSIRLFSRFKINTNFLNQESLYWKNNENYKIVTSMIKTIPVLNDIVERWIKLIEDYNQKKILKMRYKKSTYSKLCTIIEKYLGSKKGTLVEH